MQGFRFSLFYLCIFINNPVISIPSAVTLRSWSIRAKFPLLFPYIFFLLIFYPPIAPSRNTRLRFMISIISSCMLRISSGFILERRSRTASTFGILPLIQFFSLFDMLSGAEKMVWKLSYCSIRKSSTGMTMLNNGIDFLFLSSVKHLIFCGILYTLFI